MKAPPFTVLSGAEQSRRLRPQKTVVKEVKTRKGELMGKRRREKQNNSNTLRAF